MDTGTKSREQEGVAKVMDAEAAMVLTAKNIRAKDHGQEEVTKVMVAEAAMVDITAMNTAKDSLFKMFASKRKIPYS